MEAIRSYLLGKSITEVAMIGIIRKIQNYFADQVDVQQRNLDCPAASEQKGVVTPYGVPISALMNKELGKAYGITEDMAKTYGFRW